MSSSDGKSPTTEHQAQVFFFPDESHPAIHGSIGTENTKNPEIRKTETNNSKTNYSDDDFCILGEEAGAGIMPRHGVPEIRWLSEEPIRVMDNHFSIPLGKTDLLKAPKHFPAAILRYTLCEMTLIWHIYGGRDFSSSETPAKKHVTIDDGLHRVGSSTQGR